MGAVFYVGSGDRWIAADDGHSFVDCIDDAAEYEDEALALEVVAYNAGECELFVFDGHGRVVA